MGKKGGKQKGPVVTPRHQSGITLREESSGRKQTKGGSNNMKSILKLQHLQKLAVWTSGEDFMPSLGAFFGHHLALCGETMGIPLDHSLLPCQRCETILQPGYNCTVRIETNKAKVRHRRKKPNIATQNNVVYKCHFCSHRNLKRGTPKGHMKQICPPKAKPSLQSEPANSMLWKSNNSLEKGMGNKVEANSTDEIASPTLVDEIPITDSPATPLARMSTKLLEGKKRKRNRSGSNKATDSEGNSAAIDTEKSVSESSKRKRKSWTSLKEIAENTHNNSHNIITNLTIPFFV